MENNVVTFETAKKLKAAGFPQETYFAWIGNDVRHMPSGARTEREPALPTAQEIADQLPDGYYAVRDKVDYSHNPGQWLAWCSEGIYDDGFEIRGNTMAEALAALWLKLHQSPELLDAKQEEGK